MFGGGNIGRGFIGLLLEKAGYHVLFADVFQPLLDAVNNLKSYTVHIVDEKCEDVTVTNISAMNSTSPDLAKEFIDAELVTTAVGLTILPRIAGTFAAGIAARRAAGVTECMNIIACENAIRASSQVKKRHMLTNSWASPTVLLTVSSPPSAAKTSLMLWLSVIVSGMWSAAVSRVNLQDLMVWRLLTNWSLTWSVSFSVSMVLTALPPAWVV